jgi:UDPglucose 6-dehydrogenase
VKALIKMAEKHGVEPLMLRAVEERNAQQKQVLPSKITKIFGDDLSGKTIGVWGLSFKPGTDDMREASSLVLLENLIARNARVQAYDPVAMGVAREMLPAEWFDSGKLHLAGHQYEALEAADALVLVTEWKPFCYPDLTAMKKLMRQHIILDGRNQYDPKQMRDAEFEYHGIGR